ncbi:MAG: nucleotidyltransferase domain-containing protein [Lachnospiraceae bacterium]|nr:nucleotidyltransferase domain-containing protein [Lachnospiraceae bacterium]MBQ9567818.1 nucleotidyltransferase domain-containing protein [Lachnospiraceae bacterium]
MPSIDSIQESLIPIFGRYNVRKAVLFGSYAKGTANERSDIDIFVDSGLRGLKFFGLLEDVTNALNRQVDLIDASQVDSGSRVLSEINNTGVLIYGE